MSTSIDGFTEVYDTRTGLVSRVPAHFLGDPMVGRFFKPTPAQRLFDGELGDVPTEDSTVPVIRAFAADAEVDVTGLSTKAELLDAIHAALGTEPGAEPLLPTSPDPNAPDTGDTDTDDTESSDQPPAAGE